MDLTWQALQINEKLFQISELFFELVTFFKNNSGVGVELNSTSYSFLIV